MALPKQYTSPWLSTVKELVGYASDPRSLERRLMSITSILPRSKRKPVRSSVSFVDCYASSVTNISSDVGKGNMSICSTTQPCTLNQTKIGETMFSKHSAPMINISVQKDAVAELRETIGEILASGQDQATLQMALQVLRDGTRIENTSVSNCNFQTK